MHPHACCAPPWPPVVYVPIAWLPPPWPQTLVREVAVDTSQPAAEGLVGGSAPVHLTVEYLVEPGAVAPAVEVAVTVAGTTTGWSASGLAPGYQTLTPLAPVPAGAKVVLKANAALARLRWCETICC